MRETGAFLFFTTATPEIYTLSLHDALPISHRADVTNAPFVDVVFDGSLGTPNAPTITDRKSTRLNSSHVAISYAVVCLEKKNNVNQVAAASRFPDAACGGHPTTATW